MGNDSRQSSWLDLGDKLDLNFHRQFTFQSSCNTTKICPVMVYLLIQFSKFLVCCIKSDPYMCTQNIVPGVHKQLYGVIFLSSSLTVLSLILFGLFFLHRLSRMLELYLSHSAIYFHNGSRAQVQGQREKTMGVESTIWNHSSTKLRERVLAPAVSAVSVVIITMGHDRVKYMRTKA